LYPITKAKYDLKKPQAMSMTNYSGYEEFPTYVQGIEAGQYFSLAPSKTTKPLKEFVPLVDGLLEKMYPKKNGRIITIPGLTMNKDILWELADVDVSHIQRRVRNETAKNQQPKRTDTMLATSQGKAPAYAASATVPDQVTVGLQSHADKRKAQEDAARQKRLEELMREIQAEGGSVGAVSPSPAKVTKQIASPNTGHDPKVKF
jgi:hypothetical protein